MIRYFVMMTADDGVPVPLRVDNGQVAVFFDEAAAEEAAKDWMKGWHGWKSYQIFDWPFQAKGE